MSLHMHKILHEELQGFDIFKYMDVSFLFSADLTRQLTFRLIFCQPKDHNNSRLGQLFGDNLSKLSINVVSFYNVASEGHSTCDLFDRPPEAVKLTAAETRYLYRILGNIIFKVIEVESIQILTFQAYSPRLKKLYDRLIRKYALSNNLNVDIEGANYAIWTNH